MGWSAVMPALGLTGRNLGRVAASTEAAAGGGGSVADGGGTGTTTGSAPGAGAPMTCGE
jgi:hypothetical protein